MNTHQSSSQSNVSVRSELKKLVVQIETLAHETYNKLNNGTSVLEVGNELVKNVMTLVFGFGELHASEKQNNTAQTQTSTVSSSISNKSVNWHNVRDSRGRFAKNVVRP